MKRLVLLIALATAAPLAAQAPTDSSLAMALRLVTEGQGDSARALVRARLARLASGDSLYPETLYVSAVVAGDMESAIAALRRLSVEYSQSSWADQALLRIAQLRFAAGEYAQAGRFAERVLDDYPFSDVRAAAAFWAARVRLEQGDVEGACAFLNTAAADAGDDVELANRASFYLQRCSAVAQADTAAADTTQGAAVARDTVFAVQVVAVRTAAAADEAMRSLRRAGFEPRVMRDADGLFKVRVGRLRTRREARRLQAQIRRKVGGSPFVVGEP